MRARPQNAGEAAWASLTPEAVRGLTTSRIVTALAHYTCRSYDRNTTDIHDRGAALLADELNARIPPRAPKTETPPSEDSGVADQA